MMTIPVIALAAVSVAAPESAGAVLVAEVRGPVTPVTLEYVRAALQHAARRQFGVVVLEMDTPGGLAASTEELIRDILGSSAPVVVYVTPAGAQAASAGLYITNAADVAAMAPGTRIGAGHPVSIGGGDPGGGEEKGRDYLGEKIENDMAAGVRSIATNRGRNAEVYERMVRESISLTEREALEQGVVDLVAGDLDELLEALNGRAIKRFNGDPMTLSLSPSQVERFEMTTRQRVLAWVADPRIAFILLGIGMLGLYVEFNNPGLIAPGVVGGVALILFAMSVQILPVNVLGLVLIALAISLFILEIKFTSYGFLTLGGILGLTLGFLMLFDTDEIPALRVPLAFILPTSITIGLVMGLVTLLVVLAHRAPVRTGVEGLVGEIGDAVTAIGSTGKVFVHGEYWDATSPEPIERGRKVRIKMVKQMGLEVEPADR